MTAQVPIAASSAAVLGPGKAGPSGPVPEHLIVDALIEEALALTQQADLHETGTTP
ncbi:hypothetical protein [Nocardia sp. NBC_00403]|uniref:hypothetical protein n=1 Tax=Nocardia sp. NBC_00403 TaxID=2975990 RepID=UPI002E1E1FB8